jgi:hypothetical protein
MILPRIGSNYDSLPAPQPPARESIPASRQCEKHGLLSNQHYAYARVTGGPKLYEGRLYEVMVNTVPKMNFPAPREAAQFGCFSRNLLFGRCVSLR